MYRLPFWRVRARRGFIAALFVAIAALIAIPPIQSQPAKPAAVPSVMIPDDAAAAKLTEAGVKFLPENTPVRKVFLGQVRTPAAKLAKVLKLANYVTPSRATPASVDYSHKAMVSIRRMYGNDVEGDCVLASSYHRVGVWSGNDGPVCQVVPDALVHTMYMQLAVTPNTDSGCVIGDVLEYAMTAGLPLADGTRPKLDGYALVDHTNQELVKIWISEFGGGPIGINLPDQWHRSGDGSTWDIPTGRGATVVGGHDVNIFGYNATGPLASTWAGTRQFTWRAFLKAARNDNDWGLTEAWAPLSPLWYGNDKLTPAGVNVAKLMKDLATIKAGGVPTDDPVPPSPPPTGGFTGTVTTTTTFVNGAPTVVVLGGGTAPKVTRAEIEAMARTQAAAMGINWQPLIDAIVQALLKYFGGMGMLADDPSPPTPTATPVYLQIDGIPHQRGADGVYRPRR